MDFPLVHYSVDSGSAGKLQKSRARITNAAVNPDSCRRENTIKKWTYTMKEKVLWLLISLVSGCSVVAPEREAASNMMGRNIAEAYSKFGQPNYVETHVGSADDKLNGQKVYTFERFGARYNTYSAVGSETAPVNGQLTHTEYIQTNTVQESCTVRLFAGKDNIVDYYEVAGNCGLWDAGFGTTGPLHRYGIN
ncbi:hypothetical protein [Pseudomonas sp. UBA1879]|uniref:hypothetical protein n=1 Tax=Pseudomonas sp. UBA1879 TaxID=1947305 RepID=UPI0025DB9247|nr:hypothetical protein [Pseudomonas sp. UBA1879]